jgi:hypothetical protein
MVWERRLGPAAARVSVDVIRANDLQIRTVKVATELAIEGKRIDLLQITLRQSGMDKMLQRMLVHTLTSKQTWNALFDRLSDLNSAEELVQLVQGHFGSWIRNLPTDQIQFTLSMKWNNVDLLYMQSSAALPNSWNKAWESILFEWYQSTAHIYLDQNHQLALSNGLPLIFTMNGIVQNIHRIDVNKEFVQKYDIKVYF